MLGLRIFFLERIIDNVDNREWDFDILVKFIDIKLEICFRCMLINKDKLRWKYNFLKVIF